MRIAMFYHSLISDWNHGNAHFLRGILAELLERGHDVRVYEPQDGWSVSNLVREAGLQALIDFSSAYPGLESHRYELGSLDMDSELEDRDLVIVHEWNDLALVNRLGEHRACAGYKLLFHDTHHRMVTEPGAMSALDLTKYDGVLAYGSAIRDKYLAEGRVERVWVWHEAADTRVFFPQQSSSKDGDLVWIGNWGDEERTAELHEFLLKPIQQLHLRARVHGVRYPQEAIGTLRQSGIEYGGWIANYRVPEVFSRFRVTMHIPRRPYAQALPGIPTIRVFEALACGIPLVCAPWDDTEGLFVPGKDYLVARDSQAMTRCVKTLLNDADMARELAFHGLQTIRGRHTCFHRVNELEEICRELNIESAFAPPRAADVGVV